MTELIVLSGFSGSGKSTLAGKLLAERAGATILRSDDFHHTYRPGQDVTAFLIDTASAMVRHGVSVIVDGVNLHPGDRPRWNAAALTLPCTYRWIHVDTPLPVCLHRNARRPNPLRAEIILRQAAGAAI